MLKHHIFRPVRVRMLFVLAGLVLSMLPAMSQASAPAATGTISMVVESRRDGMRLRIYRTVGNRPEMISEFKVDTGESAIKIEDGTALFGFATYELRWVTEGGTEYLVGRGSPVPLLAAEDSDLLVSSSQSLQLVCEKDFQFRDTTDQRLEPFALVGAEGFIADVPYPPPDGWTWSV